MKKNFLNKFMSQALLAVFLTSGMGSVWGMEAEHTASQQAAAKNFKAKEPSIEVQKTLADNGKKAAAEDKGNAQNKLKDALIATGISYDQAEALVKANNPKAIAKALNEQKHLLKSEEQHKIAIAQTWHTAVQDHDATIKLKTAELKELDEKTPITLKSAGKWLLDNKGKMIVLGGGSIAALGGIIGEIMNMVGEVSHQSKEVVNDIKKDWGIGQGGAEASNGNGIMQPNALATADPNDPDYNKTLTDIAALFTDFNKDFKDMLEKNTDYNSKVIKIEVGTVTLADGTDVKVSIKYVLEEFTVGQALVPVLITLDPQEINGFAVTPNDVLSKMSDGPGKNLLQLILNPTASLIFTIKLILMHNSISNDSTLSDFAKIEEMLDKVTELYSRFILSKDEDIAPGSLLSYLQQYPAIVDILNDKKVKIYQALVDDKDTSLEKQKTAFMDMTKSELVEGPLTDAIQIYYNHFSQIYFKKFEHDGDYVDFSVTPGLRQTKNMLFAIFFRALKDIDRAGQELAATDGNVTLHRLDGTTYEVDPKADFTNLISKPSDVIETAKNAVKGALAIIKQTLDAAKAAKKTIKSKDLQSAADNYTKTFDHLISACTKADDAVAEFRRKLAPYYPLTWDDGASITPGEFLVAEIATLNKIDPKNLTRLLPTVYSPFKRFIGLTQEQLLGKTQEHVLDSITATVISKTPTVISKVKELTSKKTTIPLSTVQDSVPVEAAQ